MWDEKRFGPEINLYMKYLKNYAVFEGGSSYKFGFKVPTSQAEVDVINSYPEMDKLREVCKTGRSYTNVGYRYNQRSGSVEIDCGLRYGFKLTKNGTIYYGGLTIGPSTNYVFNDWHSITDYITIYAISKYIAFNANQLDKFVFDGKQIPVSTFSKITKSPFKDVVIEIANKYNPGLANELVTKREKEISQYITDTEKILQTQPYKYLSGIFGISVDENSRRGPECIRFNQDKFSPFGIFDSFIKSKTEGRYFRYYGLEICLGAEDYKIKTERGLERLVFNELKNFINSNQKSLEREAMRNPDLVPISHLIRNMITAIFSNNQTEADAEVESMMIDALEKLKLSSPINFSNIIQSIKSQGTFGNVLKHFEKDSEIVKGGSMLRKFNIFDDSEEDQ